MDSNSTPDCCEGSCPDPCCYQQPVPTGCDSCPQVCWSCVYDFLQPGERVVGKPIIAGGLVFVTSFTPTNTAATDLCQAGGAGYLYAFDYMCKPFPFGFSPIQDPTLIAEQFTVTTGGQTATYGLKVNLGSGVPSQPVLNSSGNYLFTQMSTAKMVVTPVNLLEKMNQIQGWREQPTAN